MALHGKSFTYNGRSSEDFDLIIGGFQSVDTPLNLARDITKSTMNRYRHRTNTYGINYNDVLTFNIQLIKDPCKYSDQKDMRFTREQIREIAAWLTSPITPRIFHMFDFPEMVDQEYDYYGIFTNMSAQDNEIYCLNCLFECNTPYALSAEQNIIIDDGEGIVSNPSDEFEDYVYPVIIITPTADVDAPYDIRLINESDGNRSITLKNMKPQDTVTMDCQKMTVKNQSGSLMSLDDLNIDVVDYIYWFRLLHGDNQIKVSGDAIVEFIFRYPVKVGAY